MSTDLSKTNLLYTKAFGNSLQSNANDEQKFKEIFLQMSYLNSHGDELKEKVLNDLIENGIDSLSNYAIDMIEDFKSLALFPYSGNKIKFKNEMIQMYEYAHNEDIDTVVDTFLGAGGSISSLYHTFLEKGIKTLIVNDFNHTVINTHKNVAQKEEELINSVINTYRTIYLLGDDMFNPSPETLKKLREAFLAMEHSEKYEEVQTSSLFLFFQHITFSGAYKGIFEGGKDFKTTEATAKIYDMGKYFQGILNTIVKIKEYNKIYNSFDIVFMNDDYIKLVESFRNNEKVVFLFDPPYYASSANYGLKKGDFNQIKLLEQLSGLNFLYNNNKHREIFDFIKRFNYHSMSKLRRNNSSSASDVPVYEYLVASNLDNIESVEFTVS